MKKKIFSSLLFGALAFATLGTVVSCKDYDDDISGLSSRIDALETTIDNLKSSITSGNYITSVEEITGGVRVTLSNNKTYDIVNGKNGDDGVAWSIGTDGYWYKGTEKTSYYALGTKGDDGDKGQTGDYYLPKADGYFYKVDAQGTETKTEIQWKTTDSGSTTTGKEVYYAVLDNNDLVLYNVPNAEGIIPEEGIVISRTAALRGLVFAGDAKDEDGEIVRAVVDGMPCIYVASFNHQEMTWDASGKSTKNTPSEKLIGVVDKESKAVNIKTDTTSYAYYHVNPSNVSEKEFAKLAAYVKSDVESRAASSKFKVEEVAFTEVSEGIAKVKITTSGTPASADAYSMFALQATNSAEEIITSDYAVIYAGKKLDGLAIASADEDVTLTTATNGFSALTDREKGIEIAYNEAESVDLSKYVTISPDTKSMEELGLSFAYSVVTNDFADVEKKIDQGKFITVSASGELKPADASNTAAINYNPVVRVELLYNGSKIVDAAYIPVNITGSNKFDVTETTEGKWDSEVGGFNCVYGYSTTNSKEMKLNFEKASFDVKDGKLTKLADLTSYAFAIDESIVNENGTKIGGYTVKFSLSGNKLSAVEADEDGKFTDSPVEIASVSTTGGVSSIALADNELTKKLLNTGLLTIPVGITGKQSVNGKEIDATITVNGSKTFNVKFERPIDVTVQGTPAFTFGKYGTDGEVDLTKHILVKTTWNDASLDICKLTLDYGLSDNGFITFAGDETTYTTGEYTFTIVAATDANNTTTPATKATPWKLQLTSCGQSTDLVTAVTKKLPISINYVWGTIEEEITVTINPVK